jgi:cystathionine gamma-synthase
MKSSDAIAVPIVQTAAYTFKDSQQLIDFNEGRYDSFEYGRYGNPTVRAVEQKMMELEGAEDCLASASGMYTAVSMMMALLPEGSRIITTTDCYRRTRQFLNTVINKMGVTNVVIPPGDIDALKREVQKGAAMFFSESPSNPMLRCVDIPAASEICRAAGTILCIDGTFSTPYNQRPLDLGADIVIHSATKYLAGHHDVLAGVLSGRADLVKEVRNLHGVIGGVLDPHAGYLLLRGLKTLHLRVAQQNTTADALARLLHSHPKVCAACPRAAALLPGRRAEDGAHGTRAREATQRSSSTTDLDSAAMRWLVEVWRARGLAREEPCASAGCLGQRDAQSDAGRSQADC